MYGYRAVVLHSLSKGDWNDSYPHSLAKVGCDSPSVVLDTILTSEPEIPLDHFSIFPVIDHRGATGPNELILNHQIVLVHCLHL